MGLLFYALIVLIIYIAVVMIIAIYLAVADRRSKNTFIDKFMDLSPKCIALRVVWTVLFIPIVLPAIILALVMDDSSCMD